METRVLIVEDNLTNLLMIEKLVGQVPGCMAMPRHDPRSVITDLATLAYDVALIDYQMPGMNGVDLIREIKRAPSFADQPIVMITADQEKSIRLEAIQTGAVDFLYKPIDPVEFKARLANIAHLSCVQRKLADRAQWLRSEVDKATCELREREEEIVHRLSLAAGYKDRETAEHTIRMARYCRAIAEGLGLDAELCRDIELAAPMHDIGKVGIRDAVLLKPGRLDEDERAHMNQHTAIGAAILAGSRSRLLRLAAEIAEAHHERWNGTGYPKGLSGDAIPLVGRIAAVADVFDALTTERPYKDAWSVESACSYLSEKAGAEFDPACVASFLVALGRRADGRPFAALGAAA